MWWASDFIGYTHVNRHIHTYKHTHRALNHLHSLVAELLNDASYIHYSLLLSLVQATVNSDQRSSPTYTSTIMDTQFKKIQPVFVEGVTCSELELDPSTCHDAPLLSCGKP